MAQKKFNIKQHQRKTKKALIMELSHQYELLEERESALERREFRIQEITKDKIAADNKIHELERQVEAQQDSLANIVNDYEYQLNELNEKASKEKEEAYFKEIREDIRLNTLFTTIELLISQIREEY